MAPDAGRMDGGGGLFYLSSEQGFFRIDCPQCADPDRWLVCTKCRQASSFVRSPNGQIECSCGSTFAFATCVCGAKVNSGSLKWTPLLEGPANLNTSKSLGEYFRELGSGFAGCLSGGTGLVAAVVALIACCGICTGSGPGGTSAAHEAVLKQLRSPSTAKFAETVSYGNGRYYVAVDAQNGFGAQIRTGFCVALAGSDPNAPEQEQVFECSKDMAAIVFGK